MYEFLWEVCGDWTSDRGTIPCWFQRVYQGQDITEDKEALVCLYLLQTTHRQLCCYHFWRRRVICDEIALESGIQKIIHALCFNWGVTKKKGHCLLNDSARPYITQTIRTVFTDYRWEALPHPAYSPDFYLFPKLKELQCDQWCQC